MATAPEAVLFDLDGTLIDTEPLCEAVVREVCAEIDIEISDAWYDTLVGTGWHLMFDELARGRDQATRDWIGQQVIERYDRALAAGAYQVPGGAAFIEHLQRHTRLAIVTGSTRRQLEQIVAQLGVAHVFEFFIVEDDLTRSKPDPQCYQMALARLGVPPERTLVFEDSYVGITAAKAAGCRVVAVTGVNHRQQNQRAADHHVVDHRGLDIAWCRSLFT